MYIKRMCCYEVEQTPFIVLYLISLLKARFSFLEFRIPPALVYVVSWYKLDGNGDKVLQSINTNMWPVLVVIS